MDHAIIIKRNTISLEKLYNFYEENVETFIPSLTTQVASLPKYVHKLKRYATLFEAYEGSQLVGLAAIYLNNLETKIGFITSVIVTPEYQNNGIANMLIKNVVDFSKGEGFVKIGLEVFKENVKAINLYRKYKFNKIHPPPPHQFKIHSNQYKDSNFIKMELVL
jgi:ribosomal protein S18 acetylase RimI-like enzyme